MARGTSTPEEWEAWLKAQGVEDYDSLSTQAKQDLANQFWGLPEGTTNPVADAKLATEAKTQAAIKAASEATTIEELRKVGEQYPHAFEAVVNRATELGIPVVEHIKDDRYAIADLGFKPNEGYTKYLSNNEYLPDFGPRGVEVHRKKDGTFRVSYNEKEVSALNKVMQVGMPIMAAVLGGALFVPAMVAAIPGMTTAAATAIFNGAAAYGKTGDVEDALIAAAVTYGYSSGEAQKLIGDFVESDTFTTLTKPLTEGPVSDIIFDAVDAGGEFIFDTMDQAVKALDELGIITVPDGDYAAYAAEVAKDPANPLNTLFSNNAPANLLDVVNGVKAYETENAEIPIQEQPTGARDGVGGVAGGDEPVGTPGSPNPDDTKEVVIGGSPDGLGGAWEKSIEDYWKEKEAPRVADVRDITAPQRDYGTLNTQSAWDKALEDYWAKNPDELKKTIEKDPTKFGLPEEKTAMPIPEEKKTGSAWDKALEDYWAKNPDALKEAMEKNPDAFGQPPKGNTTGDSNDIWVWNGTTLVNTTTGEGRRPPNTDHFVEGKEYYGDGELVNPEGTETSGRTGWYINAAGVRTYGAIPAVTYTDGYGQTVEGTNPNPPAPYQPDPDGLLTGPGARDPKGTPGGPPGGGPGPGGDNGDPSSDPSNPDGPNVPPVVGPSDTPDEYTPVGNAFAPIEDMRYTPTQYDQVTQADRFNIGERNLQAPPIIPAQNSGQASYDEWLAKMQREKLKASKVGGPPQVWEAHPSGLLGDEDEEAYMMGGLI